MIHIKVSSSFIQIPFQLRARKIHKVKQLIIVVRQLRAKIPVPLTTDILSDNALAIIASVTYEGI